MCGDASDVGCLFMSSYALVSNALSDELTERRKDEERGGANIHLIEKYLGGREKRGVKEWVLGKRKEGEGSVCV